MSSKDYRFRILNCQPNAISTPYLFLPYQSGKVWYGKVKTGPTQTWRGLQRPPRNILPSWEPRPGLCTAWRPTAHKTPEGLCHIPPQAAVQVSRDRRITRSSWATRRRGKRRTQSQARVNGRASPAPRGDRSLTLQCGPAAWEMAALAVV